MAREFFDGVRITNLKGGCQQENLGFFDFRQGDLPMGLGLARKPKGIPALSSKGIRKVRGEARKGCGLGKWTIRLGRKNGTSTLWIGVSSTAPLADIQHGLPGEDRSPRKKKGHRRRKKGIVPAGRLVAASWHYSPFS